MLRQARSLKKELQLVKQDMKRIADEMELMNSKRGMEIRRIKAGRKENESMQKRLMRVKIWQGTV